jgi:hypothetical protein
MWQAAYYKHNNARFSPQPERYILRGGGGGDFARA